MVVDKWKVLRLDVVQIYKLSCIAILCLILCLYSITILVASCLNLVREAIREQVQAPVDYLKLVITFVVSG